MAVYSGSVTYTVFSKMAYILTSRCVSLKLQFQHFVKKPGVLAITVLRKLPACSQSCPEWDNIRPCICFSSLSKHCDLKDDLCQWIFMVFLLWTHKRRPQKRCVMYSLYDCCQRYVPSTRRGKGKCKCNICLVRRGSELPGSKGQAEAALRIRSLLYPCSKQQDLPLHFLTAGTNLWCLLTSWWHEVVAPAPALGKDPAYN